MNPEVESQLDVRLGLTEAQKAELAKISPNAVTPEVLYLEEDWSSIRPPKPEPPNPPPPKKDNWDAGTGTSHKKGDY